MACSTTSAYCYSESTKTTKDSTDYYSAQATEAMHSNKYAITFDYAHKLISYSERNQNNAGIILGYNLLATCYQHNRKFKEAKMYYEKALKKAHITEGNETLLPKIYNNLGIIAYESGDYDTSIGHLKTALQICKTDDSNTELANIVSFNLSELYLLWKRDPQEALPYIKPILNVVENKTDKMVKVTPYEHFLIGVYYSETGRYDEAIEMFDHAIENAEEQAYFIDMSLLYHEKSKTLKALGQFKKAFKAYDLALEHLKDDMNKQQSEYDEMMGVEFKITQYEDRLRAVQELNKVHESSARKTKVITYLSWGALLVASILLSISFKNYWSKRKLTVKLANRNNELQDARDKAEKLVNIKSNFISMVSHELRTPLYAVVGITTLLKDDPSLVHKDTKYLESLKLSSDHLLLLINDILKIGKIESNTEVVDKLEFNPLSLIEKTKDSLQILSKESDTSMYSDIDKSIPKVLLGDKIKLQRILMNLISNAIKYTHNGHVWIRIKVRDKEAGSTTLRFEVEDNGIGIPKEKQDVIFEDFSQLNRNDKNFEGTGLGLAIVKKLLHLLGSEIQLESTVGKGSKFFFDVPFEIGVEKAADVSHIQVSEALHHNAKILVVEDNKINQMITQRMLKKENFLPTVVNNGEEAVAIMEAGTFDLILMDLNMPVMDGFRATLEIRKFNKDVPIVALTAMVFEDVLEQLVDCDFDDIIVKPYDTDEFFQTIFTNLKNKSHKKTIAKLLEKMRVTEQDVAQDDFLDSA